MSIYLHEFRLSKTSMIIWTSAISLFMILCIFLYPSMREQMKEISETFANMGTFSQAFGLDKVSFGTIMGYYSVECGNVLGLGGAFFAAITGINVIAKEEKEHTAEFLISHPIKRSSVVFQKAMVVLSEVVILNMIVYVLSLISLLCIKEDINYMKFTLIHLAYLLMQIEIAFICFGISSLSLKGSIGIGLGLAAIFYFINIIANLMDKLSWVKYFTPFGFCDGATIISSGKLDYKYIIVGYIVMILCVGFSFYYYNKKDIKG